MSRTQLLFIKIGLHVLCVAPLLVLVYALFMDHLGANPLEVFIRRLGEWGLQLLLVTLCMTPLRDLLGQSWPIQVRRLLGLWSFAYVVLHFMSYLWLEQFFDWAEIGLDILKRPYITFGMLAVLGLLPLALTSTRAMQRRLGRNWQRLHRLVYVVAILGVLHFFWLVKADLLRPVVFAFCLIMLLGYRIWRSRTRAASS